MAAGVPKDDPAFKKALIFVSRCQNLKGENNDQPWAGKINDGSFIYSAAAGGQTKVRTTPTPDGGLPGYGSMTYAGIKSLIYCGVSKDDQRVKKAYEWIQKNYTRRRATPACRSRGRVGPVLLLPHDGQVPGRAGRRRGRRTPRARSTTGAPTSPRPWPSGSSRTAAGSTSRTTGWKATRTWSPATP